MKQVLSISEVVETREGPDGPWELMAEGEARYNEAQSVLLVKLEAYVRPGQGPVRHRRSDQEHWPYRGWTDRRDTVVESVPMEEAVPAAKEIFQRWVLRVRKSIPQEADYV